ncbi:rhodanese-like domain-containing protein [Psychromonas sp. Urea-02u-13]|uniref:rhodanese-like domain-containing protein n=1 Tax=Psychromonas sp. Urea-02u-13 TaxID=2058326 RepID=UPI000C32F0C3|nr:rhodanese-like domain-containing protein [Psychromonas sp. Urea-02u-13]PKG40707.1 sulfurtransferase [Psychromonas sp. Urea-02u-13]
MAINGRTLVAQLRDQVAEISVLQLHEELQFNPQAIVIDIREVSETKQGSIANAALIPRGILEMKIDSHSSIQQRFSNLDELAEQPIYLLCRSGARSIFSALSLKQMGFKDVYSVEGGFLAWQAADYKVSIVS